MTAPVDPRGWPPPDPNPTPGELRRRALADQLRDLIAQVVHLDPEAADTEELAATLGQAQALVSDLPKLEGGFWSVQPFGISLFERSPLTGRSNALAAPLLLEYDGLITRGHATYGPAYEGPPGSVHGGYVIAAFDDLLGVAQAASGTAGFTGTLSVRLVGRTPLGERIDYEGGVTSVEGRKISAWGRSTWNGELLAECTAVFIAPREGYAQATVAAAHGA